MVRTLVVNEPVCSTCGRVMTVHRVVADNVFCPTGSGGGVDPSCGKGRGGEAVTEADRKNALSSLKKLPLVKIPKDRKALPKDAFVVEAVGPLRATPFEVDSSDETYEQARGVLVKMNYRKRMVSLDSLVAPQKAVREQSIKHMIKEIGSASRPELTEPVTVVRVGKKNFLFDGTHRATTEKLLGKTEILAEVYR